MGLETDDPSGTVTTPTAPASDTSTTSALVKPQLTGSSTLGGLRTGEPGSVPDVGTVVVVVVAVITGSGDDTTGLVVGVVVELGTSDPGAVPADVPVVPLPDEEPTAPPPLDPPEPLALDPEATGTRSKGATAQVAVKARTVTPLAVRVNKG
jgi:hypothetical protein